ncbi:MAG TPA: OmpH family outer membrane protein [Prolixibacteraceae bacterium]|jgi:outer membrane protein|nr:OmpH family outer membrane protein [Prolixibacteraceae bacterium]
MKKFIFIGIFTLMCITSSFAQKYAYVDTDYILGKLPAYVAAQEQLDKISEKYQKELETLHNELDQIYKDFQAEVVLLSNDLKRKREEQIVNKEKEYKKLQRQYFGPDGDLAKKKESLIKPVQDEVFSAIQAIAESGAYSIIFDKAGSMTMIYTNPKFDLSDQVLQKLGYKN